MNTRLFVLFVSTVSIVIGSHAASDAAVTTALERRAHETLWQTVNADGSTNEYVHLGNGLNRWSESDKAYVAANAVIEEVNGVLLARQTAHQVIFSRSSDSAEGTIDLLMPDGRRFRVRPAGLAYTEFKDGSPGKSVFIAELNSSRAELMSPTQVTYFDALDGADVQYDLSLAGLEQNVVIHDKLPKPGDLGMEEKLARLEVWSEILESPEPMKETNQVSRSDSSVDADARLDFGLMQMGAGRAFATEKADTSLAVTKSWQVIEGKTWLIESVPYLEVAPLFASVAAGGHRSVDASKVAALDRGIDKAIPSTVARRLPMKGIVRRDKGVASADIQRGDRKPGVVLDWSLLATVSNFTFKGDSTYYLNAPVTLSVTGTNTTIIEGGTVVKVTNDILAKITITGPISCRTDAYRPAVFTSKDDDSVGEKITGSTGNPLSYYGSGISVQSATLKNLRFAYAYTAISLVSSQSLTLQDSQFVKCQNAFFFNTAGIGYVENSLFTQLNGWATGGNPSVIVHGYNLTVHTCTNLTYLGSGSTVDLVNTLLIKVPNQTTPAPTLTSSASQLSDAGVFETVGAGSHYLPSGSSFRDNGTTSINVGLLDRLRKKTTSSPSVLTSDFTANTTLTSRNLQDVDNVDLGYHYDVLDYAWSRLNLTNATLTLTNGVAVAAYGTAGTILRNGAKFICGGTANQLNRLVRYNTVQEQATTNWTSSSTASIGLLEIPTMPSVLPELRLRYTDISMLTATANRRQFYNNETGTSPGVLSLEHCQWRGPHLDGRCYNFNGMTVSLTNNLIQWGSLSFYQQYLSGYYNYTLNCYNNLFLRGGHTFSYNSSGTTWTVKDNLFDCDSLTKSGTFTADYNGYKSGLTSLGGTHNKTITTFDYVTGGPLGDYYYPTTGGNLSQLIDAGSRTASAAGLAAHTVTTGGSPDGGPKVDIVYHYVNLSSPSTIVTIEATIPSLNESAPGSPGVFTVARNGTAGNLTVFYSVSGSANNGADYSYLNGSVGILAGSSLRDIQVVPINDSSIELPETVTLTLVQSDTYKVGPADHATVTIDDDENPPMAGVVLTLTDPSGIDYHPGNSSLIVSYNSSSTSGKNFLRLASNGSTSDWTTAAGLGATAGEIKLGVVPTTANGWTLGETYFGAGQPGKVGKISNSGTTLNTDWATLTNASQGVIEASSFLSGFCIDQTGVFGGDLIVVASGGGVWRVNSSTNATRLANVANVTGPSTRLEGVTVIPNDPLKYGPWAGRILTCVENSGELCTIDVNGGVTLFDMDGLVEPEDVDIVVAGWNLYCVNFVQSAPSTSTILKIPGSGLAAFAGDIIVVEEKQSRLSVFHWDGTRFLHRFVFMDNPTPDTLEHAAFAPIDLSP